MTKKIWICGMSGAGKSHFVNAIKDSFSEVFLKIDMDEVLAKNLDISPLKLGEWINTYGESTFRKKESDLVKSILQKQTSAMISMGGGALSDENLSLILNDSKSRLVYLEVEFEILHERINNDPSKFLNLLPQDEIAARFFAREKNFQKAHLKLDTNALKSIDSIDTLVHTLY
jgi:shikimate kinase